MNKKLLLGALAGGIALFLGGWIIYGMVLQNFTAAHMNQCMIMPMENMRWWAIISSNLLTGFMLALVLNCAKVSNAREGAQYASVLGILWALSTDLNFYSMTTYYDSLSTILVDVTGTTIMMALSGISIGFVYSKKV